MTKVWNVEALRSWRDESKLLRSDNFVFKISLLANNYLRSSGDESLT